jgi:ribosome-associated translation inhibitor RaiA
VQEVDAMRIDVRNRAFKADDGLRNYIGLRLMSVLDHLVRQVNDVVVCLADVPARDGEVGKRCRMLARLAPSGAARVEETDSDLYGAIDRAAEELARAIAPHSLVERRLLPTLETFGRRVGRVTVAFTLPSGPRTQ